MPNKSRPTQEQQTISLPNVLGRLYGERCDREKELEQWAYMLAAQLACEHLCCPLRGAMWLLEHACVAFEASHYRCLKPDDLRLVIHDSTKGSMADGNVTHRCLSPRELVQAEGLIAGKLEREVLYYAPGPSLERSYLDKTMVLHLGKAKELLAGVGLAMQRSTPESNTPWQVAVGELAAKVRLEDETGAAEYSWDLFRDQLSEYCGYQLLGCVDPFHPLAQEIARLNSEGFGATLLRKIWAKCPETAEEWGAPPANIPLDPSQSEGNETHYRFVPTDFQNLVLNVLHGAAFKTDALAKKIGYGRERLFKRNGIKELCTEGLVESHKVLGYFRPDALPADLRDSDSAGSTNSSTK